MILSHEEDLLMSNIRVDPRKEIRIHCDDRGVVQELTSP
jgi:hypothetical protein